MNNKWDKRFMDLAEMVASWSKDPSTQTGAVIVRPNKTIVSVGYNGFPRGMDDSDERLNDRDDKYRRIVHCEMNAILNAEGQSLRGCTLYVWPFLTCDRCSVYVIQAGIVKVVAPSTPPDKENRWGEMFSHAMGYYKETGVEVLIR